MPHDEPRPSARYLLRTAADGDLEWIVQRHKDIYTRDHGWGPAFDALVARIIADFARSHDPQRERCWIGEVDGKRAGSIMLVRVDDATAKLRVLLVEPEARGRGLGAGLVNACVRFARDAGYRRITLWTCSVLVPARRLYESAGFRLVQERPDPMFDEGELAQEWELDLAA